MPWRASPAAAPFLPVRPHLTACLRCTPNLSSTFPPGPLAQIGLDDTWHVWFRDQRLEQGRALLRDGSIPACRAFARRGCPQGVRGALWEAALGLGPMTDDDCQLVHSLCRGVQGQQLLTDLLVTADMVCVADSDQLFLFEELLKAVLLAFSRDRSVLHHCAVDPCPAFTASYETVPPIAGLPPVAPVTAPFPPSGALPHRGLSLLAAPLCYFCDDDPAVVYRLFRAMYCRYWCKLYSFAAVGQPSPAMPVLARTLDSLLERLDPELWSHLNRIGCPGLKAAFPFLSTAFVDHLSMAELLLLWDRIVGFDSLLPVVLLAVAVLVVRRKVLLAAGSPADVSAALEDISQLKVVPLLQSLLFGTTTL